jgi:SAM-dependent methyltransferase
MPSKFAYRCNEKELLDETNILPGLLYKNLRELDILNRLTGAHNLTLKGVKQLITEKNKIYHVVDLGCGSGDVLMTIADWARLNDFKVRLTGIDFNIRSIDYLKFHCAKYPEITGISSDYKDYLNRGDIIDIIHSSLFCHHLNDEELLSLFIYFRQHVKVGFIINDLRRERLAYYSVWLLTRVLNGTNLAKNDGPVSVLRGFKSYELSNLLIKANILNYSIKKAFAFRYLILGKTQIYE